MLVEDAKRSVDIGALAFMASNHGGQAVVKAMLSVFKAELKCSKVRKN